MPNTTPYLIDDALRLIISRSDKAAPKAIEALNFVRRRASLAQGYYNESAHLALGDASVEWTPAEREVIARFMTIPLGSNRMTAVLVRMTTRERAALDQMVEASGKTQSQFIRNLIFPK